MNLRRGVALFAAALAAVFAMDGGTAYALTRASAGPPTAPTNLEVTATTYDSVSLSWGASADGSSPVTYTIVVTNPAVDAGSTGRIPDIRTTSYDWSNGLVQPGQTYSFTVFAVNSAGQDSADSNSVSTTTPAAPLPPAPQVTVTGTTAWTVTLTISDSLPGGGFVGESILVNGQAPQEYPGSLYPDQSGTVTLLKLSAGTTYSVAVTAYNDYGQDGGTTTISATTLTTTGTTPPSAPSNFSVEDYLQDVGYGCTEQTITWSPSADPNYPQSDLYYEIIINGVDSGPVNDILGNQISGGVLSELVYLPVGTDTIDVVAVDPSGLVSPASNSFTGNFIADC
jgi:Fibronectin type III domain